MKKTYFLLITFLAFSANAVMCKSPLSLTKRENSLSFANFSNKSSKGQCYGIAVLQRRLAAANYQSGGPKDSAATIQQKLDKLAKGEAVTFNGYANMRALSSANVALFKSAVSAIQLQQKNAGTAISNGLSFLSGTSSALSNIEKRVGSGDKVVLGFNAAGTMNVGHAVVVDGFTKNGSSAVLTISDPNTPGSAQKLTCTGETCTGSSTIRGKLKIFTMNDPNSEGRIAQQLTQKGGGKCSPEDGKKPAAPGNDGNGGGGGDLMSWLNQPSQQIAIYFVPYVE